MSRFDHLEIGRLQPVRPVGETEDPGIIDQHYYMTKADQAFVEENFERALSLYSRALQYDAGLEDAWLGQLRCLIELHELQEAIIWAERALERFPNSAQVLAARGVAGGRLGRSSEALKYADSAFTAQGVTPYVWVARGEILIPLNAINAKACFSKALEMSPGNQAIHAWIGRSYLVHGGYPQALEHLRNAVRVDPDCFTCWYWIGKCCEALGEIKDAKAAYLRSVAACPTFSPARSAIRQLEQRGLVSKMADGLRRLFGSRKSMEG